MASNVRDTRLAAVQSAGRFSDAVIDELARYLTESPDEKLFRMNPFRYAAETGTEESTAVELFLYAAHAGVLEFSWGVICPICGAFVRTEHALRALDQERGCAFCDITISPVMDVNVEVAFSVAPSVRTLRFHEPDRFDFAQDSLTLFFSPTVINTAHIERALRQTMWSGTVAGGATLEVENELAVGEYVVTLPEHHVATRFTVADGEGESTLNWEVLTGGRLIQSGARIAAGPVRLAIRNRLTRPVIFGAFVDPRSPDMLAQNFPPGAVPPGQDLHRFFSAKDLVTTQVFHELFRAESVPAQGGLSFRSLTVLFTDLKGSTELYSRMGDIRAYGLVREHFGVLREIVAAHSGAVVKTIGDAVMATFPVPELALEAAAAMNREIGKVGDLELKIGMHTGPCIAVDMNERLDYFGQTVNIAARVQGIADSRQIVCTDSVYEAPGVAEVIAKLAAAGPRECAALKGVDGEVGVWRFQ